MNDSASRIARTLAELDRRLKGVERGAQLARSSVELADGRSSTVAEIAGNADTALVQVQGKNRTYTSATAPEAEAEGDLWINTSENHALYRWDGTDWISVRDEDIPRALAEADAAVADAAAAQEAAAVAQTDAAAASDAAAQATSDAAAAEAAAADAVTAANNADTKATNAQQTADTALTTADGKGKAYYQTTAPSSGTENDVWFDTDNDNLPHRWDGTAWVAQPLGSQAIGNLDAGKITSGTIAAGRIGAGSITADKIGAGAVTAATIAAGAVEAGKIAAGAVRAGEIAAGAVQADKIAADAVNANKIAAGSIYAGHIATGQITAEKIAAGHVTSAKIAAGAITAEKINAGAITAEKIAAGAITADKITANAIDGKTITGGTLQTATSGTRAVIGPGVSYDGSHALGLYDSNGYNGGRLRSVDNGLRLSSGYNNLGLSMATFKPNGQIDFESWGYYGGGGLAMRIAENRVETNVPVTINASQQIVDVRYGNSTITTDASGYAWVYTGTPGTPKAVVCTGSASGGNQICWSLGTDNWQASYFRVRVLGASGGVVANTSIPISWFAFT